MTDPARQSGPTFDDYAADYDSALKRGLFLSGEAKDFFARGRVAWLTRCLRIIGESPASAMDFGCGTGSAEPFLLELAGVRSIISVDVSPRLLDVARDRCRSAAVRFKLADDHQP